MAGGGDEASREALFKDLASITEACVTRHGITAEQKGPYFDYSLARISREWLANDIAKPGLSPADADKALDFGPTGAHPDLSTELTEEQITKSVQATRSEERGTGNEGDDTRRPPPPPPPY